MSLDQERAAARAAIDNHGDALVDHETRIAAIERLLLDLPERMAEAFERSIDRKASDPQTWARMRAAWRDQAAKGIGEFFLGGLSSVGKRAAGLALIAVLVWQLAGVSGLSSIASAWARAAVTNWLNRGAP